MMFLLVQIPGLSSPLDLHSNLNVMQRRLAWHPGKQWNDMQTGSGTANLVPTVEKKSLEALLVQRRFCL
jgi:hypothetical protein